MPYNQGNALPLRPGGHPQAQARLGNGYRRYGLEQFFDFDMISLLKETGSTLGEIRVCREMHDPRAYLRLLRERAGILEKERARLARREAMLRKLIALTEETIDADFDRLLFEEKETEQIIAVPTDPEKILSGAGSVECYSACLAHDLERGNSTDAPLGMIVPAERAGKGEFRPCFFLPGRRRATRATYGKSPPDAMRPFSTRARCSARPPLSGTWSGLLPTRGCACAATPTAMI